MGSRNNSNKNETSNPRKLLHTARILSVVANLVSWIWWKTFLVSLAGMAVVQVLGRRTNNRNTGFGLSLAILCAQFAAIVCAVAHIWLGIYILENWWDVRWCEPWTLENGGHLANRWNPSWAGLCNQKIWASVAFVCGILWIIVLACLLRFRCLHGRFAKDSSNNAANNNDNPNGTTNANDHTNATDAVELGREAQPEPPPPPPPPAAAAAAAAEPSVAIPLAENKEVEGC